MGGEDVETVHKYFHEETNEMISPINYPYGKASWPLTISDCDDVLSFLDHSFLLSTVVKAT